jgi:hypothetical protein
MGKGSRAKRERVPRFWRKDRRFIGPPKILLIMVINIAMGGQGSSVVARRGKRKRQPSFDSWRFMWGDES